MSALYILGVRGIIHVIFKLDMFYFNFLGSYRLDMLHVFVYSDLSDFLVKRKSSLVYKFSKIGTPRYLISLSHRWCLVGLNLTGAHPINESFFRKFNLSALNFLGLVHLKEALALEGIIVQWRNFTILWRQNINDRTWVKKSGLSI